MAIYAADLMGFPARLRIFEVSVWDRLFAKLFMFHSPRLMRHLLDREPL